jgi:hypothetical protein
MVSSHAEDFSCPNRNAKYRLVRVKVEPEPSHGRIECYHCGGPLNGREGRFILKYFLIDRRGGNSANACQIDHCAASACRFIPLECRCGAVLSPEVCHEAT